MLPVFADPKTDVIFKRLFGDERHKHLLIELLNTLLENDEAHRIVELEHIPPDQRPEVEGLKASIVDVKCRDATGHVYVVEMQVLLVEAFEKRVVYNVSKAYVQQLKSGDEYPGLRDVVGVTICNFVLWADELDRPHVPMLSRWRLQEQHGGRQGLGQQQYVFLELPKYATEVAGEPATQLAKWAYFFREAPSWEVIPAPLEEQPFVEALESSRVAAFSFEEREAYDRAKMAEQDARGALSYARREGLEKGRQEGLEKGRQKGLEEGRQEGLERARLLLRAAVASVCTSLGVESREERLETMDEQQLQALIEHLLRHRQWP